MSARLGIGLGSFFVITPIFAVGLQIMDLKVTHFVKIFQLLDS